MHTALHWYLSNEGNNGQIQQMQDQLNSANQAISKDLQTISSIGTKTMVSGIMMTVGVLGTVLGTVLVPESKAPVSLVVAGIKGEVSTFSAAAAAEADLSRQQAIVKKETMKIAELTAEIALISTASGQLSTFLEKGKATETALLSLVEQWKVLDTQLTTVIDAVNGMFVNDGPFLFFSSVRA